MMKKMRFVLLLLSSLVLLVACGNESQGEDGKKEISIMLDWYPNAVHSFLYVAEEKGYFEEEQLDVDIQFPANTTDPLTLAAANKVTLGLYYQPDVIMAVANDDMPVISVAGIVREPLNYLVFKAEQNIQSPADLLHKKVGYPGIPINIALLHTILKDVGESPDQIDMIDVGFELGSSIITDHVDAVFGAFVNHEVPVLRHEGYDIDYLNPVEYGVPNYYELVLVTGSETWEKEQTEIEAFLRAAQKGYEFMMENPEEALDILLTYQDEANFPLDKAIETESMNVLLPKMQTTKGIHHQEADDWKKTAEWLLEVELIKEIPPMEAMIQSK